MQHLTTTLKKNWFHNVFKDLYVMNLVRCNDKPVKGNPRMIYSVLTDHGKCHPLSNIRTNELSRLVKSGTTCTHTNHENLYTFLKVQSKSKSFSS